MDELKDIKVGDEIYYYTGYYGTAGQIIKVTKITPTQIVCDKSRFRKDNGKLVGYHDSWHFPQIVILTKELKEKTIHGNLSKYLNNFNFNTLNLDQLQQIKLIVQTKVEEK